VRHSTRHQQEHRASAARPSYHIFWKAPVHTADPVLFVCVQRWGVTLADDFVPSAATTEYTSFLLRAAEHEVSAHVVGC